MAVLSGGYMKRKSREKLNYRVLTDEICMNCKHYDEIYNTKYNEDVMGCKLMKHSDNEVEETGRCDKYEWGR